MKTRNPTTKQALKTTKHLLRQVTRNNTTGIMPVPDITQDMNTAAPPVLQQLTQTHPQPRALLPGAHNHIVMQEAINVLTLQEQGSTVQSTHPARSWNMPKCYYTLNTLWAKWYISNRTYNLQLQKADERPNNCRSTANGIRIEFWGNGTRGRQDRTERHKCNVCDDSQWNSTCNHGKKVFTYGNPVVDDRPQKEFPHCIWITAGGNLINYK